jgi:hypothetical protein
MFGVNIPRNGLTIANKSILDAPLKGEAPAELRGGFRVWGSGFGKEYDSLNPEP